LKQSYNSALKTVA